MPWSAYYGKCLNDEHERQMYEQQMEEYYNQMQEAYYGQWEKEQQLEEDKENYPLFFLKDGIV